MELEPFSPIDAYPRFLDCIEIPAEGRTEALLNFCIGNFTHIHEIKSVLNLYKSFMTEGLSTDESLKHLESLLPTSKIHTHSLVKGLTTKNVHLIHTAITNLFMNGYLLDDILLSLEKNISLFPSRSPEIRFRILQFIMLGWIFIQQGKEHWLDTMDIVEKVMSK
jgi:hypothetical protein